MSLHRPAGIAKTILHLLLVILNFIGFYLLLILASVPLVLLVLYRNVLFVILYMVYKGKYKLVSYIDAYCCLDTYASMCTMSFFMYIDGPCDLAELQRRLSSAFNEVKPDGTKPWRKMFHLAVKKLGFLWWEDKTDSFDITRHVRLFPEVDDANKVYTEKEFFDAISGIADKMWEPGMPKWEFLVTPKVECADNGAVCSIITGRCSHAYGDGVSLVQIVRNCIMDSPPKMVIDPVNPPISHIPLYFKALLYIQAFFLGPNLLLRFSTIREKHIFLEGPLTGPKFFGRTTMEIPHEMLKRIRKSLKCSTMAIVNSAFCGALQNAAKRKELLVPEEVTAHQVYAKLPYPDIYPRNFAYANYDQFPIGIQDTFKRLEAFEQRFRVLSKMHYAKIAFTAMSYLTGILPVVLLQLCYDMLWSSYGVSNIPGILETSCFNGNPIRRVWGMPPASMGVRYTLGFGPYNNKFVGGFICEKSKIIGSQEEFEMLIKDFESLLRQLDVESKV